MSDRPPHTVTSQLSRFLLPLWIVGVFVLFIILYEGRGIIIPFVLAIFTWYLINALARQLGRLEFRGYTLPRLVRFPFAIVVILLVGFGLIQIVTTSVSDVVDRSGSYQRNLQRKIERYSEQISGWVDRWSEFTLSLIPAGDEEAEGEGELAEDEALDEESPPTVGPTLEDDAPVTAVTAQKQSANGNGNPATGPPQTASDWAFMPDISVETILSPVASSLASIASSGLIVLVFLLFLFIEQNSFPKKIERFFPDDGRRDTVRSILNQIDQDITTFIGVKTLVSLMVGLGSYFVMILIGVDFAPFWALLLFLFNFIPTIGSIVATIFPVVLALVQFDTLTPPIVTLVGITAVQMTVGNVIEPPLLGRSLNLSPLVILLSLGLWGSLWGIPGALLCVPITVIFLIIFSRFEQTRPIAVLLSADGVIKNPAITEGTPPQGEAAS